MTTTEKLAMKKFQCIDLPKKQKELRRQKLELQRINHDMFSTFNETCNKLRDFGVANEDGSIAIYIPENKRIVCRVDNNPGIYLVKRVIIDKNNYIQLLLIEQNEGKQDFYNILATDIETSYLLDILFGYIEDFNVREH